MDAFSIEGSEGMAESIFGSWIVVFDAFSYILLSSGDCTSETAERTISWFILSFSGLVGKDGSSGRFFFVVSFSTSGRDGSGGSDDGDSVGAIDGTSSFFLNNPILLIGIFFFIAL